jgi:hypothetical protein
VRLGEVVAATLNRQLYATTSRRRHLYFALYDAALHTLTYTNGTPGAHAVAGNDLQMLDSRAPWWALFRWQFTKRKP